MALASRSPTRDLHSVQVLCKAILIRRIWSCSGGDSVA